MTRIYHCSGNFYLYNKRNLAIDQARHLLVLPPTATPLPVIGIWCKNVDVGVDDSLLKVIYRYVYANGIRRLETGKSNLLICSFGNGKENQNVPQCYECLVKV